VWRPCNGPFRCRPQLGPVWPHFRRQALWL